MIDRQLSYGVVGATLKDGFPAVAGFLRFEGSVRVGSGDDCWARAGAALLRWEVKTRSGFAVEPDAPLGPEGNRPMKDADFWLVIRLWRWAIREPVRVVAVVSEPDRIGYAYGTLAGHPIAGEEAFLLERRPDGSVWFVLRSLTSAPRGRWRLLFPGVLVAQRIIRRRYLRALVENSAA